MDTMERFEEAMHEGEDAVQALIEELRMRREIGDGVFEPGIELVNERDSSGRTPLMMAASFARARIVKLLIREGADVREQDYGNEDALAWAAVSGDPETVTALIDAGADVNGSDSDSTVALHWAAKTGNAALVDALIQVGAEIDEKNANGETLLDVARLKAGTTGFRRIIDILEARTLSGRDSLMSRPVRGREATL